MRFHLRGDPNSIEAIYSDDTMVPDPYHPNVMRLDDRVRVGVARCVGSDDVDVIMQHLKLSDPPYAPAEMPGRSVTMSFREFSAFVDAIGALRDRMQLERDSAHARPTARFEEDILPKDEEEETL